jgi:NADH:ubiquinone oxidoreductase subunit B-like Fe-S oxidoreductase
MTIRFIFIQHSIQCLETQKSRVRSCCKVNTILNFRSLIKKGFGIACCVYEIQAYKLEM